MLKHRESANQIEGLGKRKLCDEMHNYNLVGLLSACLNKNRMYVNDLCLDFHLWLMNLHEMWNEVMKCMDCNIVGFLEHAYAGMKFIMMLMPWFHYKIDEFIRIWSKWMELWLWHVVVIMLVIKMINYV
jgi:hypothetical protein